MPTPSKFTPETRTKIIQALQVGASRRTAAAIAGIDEAQVRRWLTRGKESTEGRFHEFYEECLKAEASPRMRALGIIYKEMPENPMLAWRYVERREPGYEPPAPSLPTGQAPIVVQLAFHDGVKAALPEPVIEGEVVDVEDEPAEEGTTAPDPATTA